MNKNLIKSAIVSIPLLLSPLAALAFDDGGVPAQQNIDIPSLIDKIFSGFLWPVSVAFFIIMFIVAAFRFFTAQGEAEKVKEAQQFVIWGVVGVVVAILAFSIPLIVRNVIGT